LQNDVWTFNPSLAGYNKTGGKHCDIIQDVLIKAEDNTNQFMSFTSRCLANEITKNMVNSVWVYTIITVYKTTMYTWDKASREKQRSINTC